tara:strand:- start:5428 stop:8124 length:2697 start_codon:yes stop_codon:yes gene_type:complete
MANDKFTEKDKQNAEAIKDILEDTTRTRQKLLDLTLKQVKGEKKLSEILDEELGKQAQFLTQAEIESKLKQDQLDILEKELEFSFELDQLFKQKIEAAERMGDLGNVEQELQKEINRLKALGNQATAEDIRELTRKENKLANVIESKKEEDALGKKLEAQIEAGRKLVNSSTDDIKAKIKEQGKEKKVLDEVAAKQTNIKNIIGNQIEETIGLKDATDSLGDALIDAVFEAREQQGSTLDNLKEEIKRIQEAIGLEFQERFTGRNVFKNLKARAQDFSKDFSGRLDQLATKFLDLPVAFVQQTGQAEKLGEEFKSLTFDLSQSGFLIGETDAAFNSLITSFNGFTLADEEVRKGLTEDAAILNRLGVDTATFGGSIQNLTTGLGMTTTAASDLSKELVIFGQAIGVGANDMLEQLNNNFDILATHGRKKGVEVFKELSKTAKAAGISIQELVNIGKRFDTFEGAMKSAGKLNFILGGPLVNSMEMLNATEERRIEILRDSLRMSGKSFEDLGRRGKEALASTLGVSVAIAERLFNDNNIKSIEEATAALEENKMSIKELEAIGREKLTTEQRELLFQEQQITSQKELVETFGEVKDAILDIKQAFSGIIGIIGSLTMVFNVLSSAVTIFTAVTAAGAGAAGAVFLPVIGVVAAVAAAVVAVAGVIKFFSDETKSFGDAILDVFKFVGNAVNFVLSGVSRAFLYIIEGVFHVAALLFTGGLSVLLEGAAMVLDAIGLDSAADTLKGISPHRVIRGISSGINTAIENIPYFENGTDFAPGGMSLVGEAGAELMSVPRGAAITPAEQTKTMMSTLKTFNNIMTSSQAVENVNSVVNNQNTNVATQNTVATTQQTSPSPAPAAAGPQTMNLNLVLKMDEREIGRVAKRVSMDVMAKGLEVSV